MGCFVRNKAGILNCQLRCYYSVCSNVRTLNSRKMASGGGCRLAGPVSSPFLIRSEESPFNNSGPDAELQLPYLRKSGRLNINQYVVIALY